MLFSTFLLTAGTFSAPLTGGSSFKCKEFPPQQHVCVTAGF